MSAVSMNARLFVTVLALGLGAPAVAWAQSTDAIGSPQHFIFFGLERSRVSDPIFLATPAIAGAQLKYTWRELEPERGRYEFDAIRRDLALLERAGKRLFVQVQDVSFDPGIVNVPEYLLDDPIFGGGIALKYEFEDEDEDESRPIVDGWVARRALRIASPGLQHHDEKSSWCLLYVGDVASLKAWKKTRRRQVMV